MKGEKWTLLLLYVSYNVTYIIFCDKPNQIFRFVVFSFLLKWTFILLLSVSSCVGEESPTSPNFGKYKSIYPGINENQNVVHFS